MRFMVCRTHVTTINNDNEMVLLSLSSSVASPLQVPPPPASVHKPFIKTLSKLLLESSFLRVASIASAVNALLPSAASLSKRKVMTQSACQKETIFRTWCVDLLAPSQEKNNGLLTIDNILAPSSDNVLLRASFPGHEATILSSETSIPISANNDCIMHEKKVVALVWDRAGVEDNAAAIKL